jgi:hypothetical protein
VEQPFFKKVRPARSRSIYARRSTTHAETRGDTGVRGQSGGGANGGRTRSERGLVCRISWRIQVPRHPIYYDQFGISNVSAVIASSRRFFGGTRGLRQGGAGEGGWEGEGGDGGGGREGGKRKARSAGKGEIRGVGKKD